MARPSLPFHSPPARKVLLGILATFVLIQGVALMPSSLEKPTGVGQIDPEQLKPPASDETLAPGIPKDRVPDYTIESFEFVSTQNGEKQWKLVADIAHMFNGERLVHARRIRAFLYSAGSEPTVVTGKEAKYYVDERDLEIYGDVKTQFPDGFHTNSEYMRYRPALKHVEIPEKYEVTGESEPETKDEQVLAFRSLGMDYPIEKKIVTLPRRVRAVLKGAEKKNSDNKNVPDETVIVSDHCKMDRTRSVATFTMYPSRDQKSRFVQITQPGLYAKGRRADVYYGSFSGLVHYMTAYEDVLVQETDPDTQELRYGTGGRADFDSKNNLVRLSEFPQVYQDRDTLVGDVILMHRDTGIVEVEHGNAYSTGQKKQQ